MTTRPPGFDRDVVNCRPKLLSFARKLTRSAAIAEDLVQETVARAMLKADQFQPGTSMAAWLFMILRNEFLSGVRRGKREAEDPDGIMASILPSPAAQAVSYDLKLLFGYMEQLNFEQRVCLELKALDGMRYEEIAEIMGIPVGTVKSQISRARTRLAELCGERP